jgi:hypothetical protein
MTNKYAITLEYFNEKRNQFSLHKVQKYEIPKYSTTMINDKLFL